MKKINFDHFFRIPEVSMALEQKDFEELYDLFFESLEDCFDDNFDSKDMSTLTVELCNRGIDVLCQFKKEIPQGAFAFTTIKDVDIPIGVEYIGNDAFSGCDDVETITIHSSVKKVAYNAFEYHPSGDNCKARDIIYKGTLAEWCGIEFESYWSNPVESEYFDDKLYIEGKLIDDELVIPNGVEVINSNTFRGLYRLKRVVLPNSVKRIEDMAFYSCGNLEEIVIPNSVEYIGQNAFELCSRLNKVVFGKESRLKKIDKCAFYGCQNLVEIVLPKSLELIDRCAFEECRNLEKVSVDKNSVLTEIEQFAFSECNKLKTITLPGALRFIGKEAFDGCEALNEVHYEGTLSQWCKIHFDDSVYYMTNPLCAVENLHINGQLVEGKLTIPDDCTSIGNIAFAGRKDITSVVIPVSIKTIGQNAFAGCDDLTYVHYQGTKEQWYDIWIGLGGDFYKCLSEAETEIFPKAKICFDNKGV